MGKVDMEMSPGEGGVGMVQRTYVSEEAKGTKAPGDVVYTDTRGRRTWMDVVVVQAVGSAAVKNRKLACEVAAAEKATAWRKYFPHVRNPFVPVAMATNGCVAAVTERGLRAIVGNEGLAYVVATAMAMQAAITLALVQAVVAAGSVVAVVDVGSSDEGDSSDGGDGGAVAAESSDGDDECEDSEGADE